MKDNLPVPGGLCGQAGRRAGSGAAGESEVLHGIQTKHGMDSSPVPTLKSR